MSWSPRFVLIRKTGVCKRWQPSRNQVCDVRQCTVRYLARCGRADFGHDVPAATWPTLSCGSSGARTVLQSHYPPCFGPHWHRPKTTTDISRDGSTSQHCDRVKNHNALSAKTCLQLIGRSICRTLGWTILRGIFPGQGAAPSPLHQTNRSTGVQRGRDSRVQVLLRLS